MPQPKRSGRAPTVPYHPLVEALASDPNQPPKQATRLFGYAGPAADAKSTRLWLDLDLTSYIDVPDDAVLHSRTLPDEEGAILWVDPTATLTHSVPQQQEVQAEFLAGSIADRNLAGAPAGAAGAGSVTVPQAPWGISHIVGCRYSLLGFCRSVNVVCWSQQRWCCDEFELDRQIGAGPVGGGPLGPAVTRGFVCQSWNGRCPTGTAGWCRPQITQQVWCFEELATRTGGCPPEPWTGTTPVIDQVGPFRPQQ
jgi:hypothetical protein